MAKAVFRSSIEALDGLTIRDFPTKGVPLVKVMRSGRTVVGLDKNSNVYATGLTGNFAIRDGYGGAYATGILAALCSLGGISLAALNAYRALNEQHAARQGRKWASETMRQSAKTLGVRLTAVQLRALDAAAKGGAA